jgi:hypothetical protein
VVAVFASETPEFAFERHCELRPKHRGRRVQYDWRPNRRDDLYELAAVWAGATPTDFQEFRRSIEELCRSPKGARGGTTFISFFGD